MNICVSSYSFSRLVREGSLKPENVIYKAKEMGFYGIEFAGLWVPEGMTALDYAKHVKDLAEDAGIKITGYSVGGNLLCNNQEEEIERLKGEVDVAHALGVNIMRHDVAYGPMPGGYKSFENNLPLLIKGVRAVTEYAESLGVRTSIENHGFYTQDSHRVEMLIDGVNSDNYGALLDLGNFLCVDEDPAKATGVLKNYVFSVHAKDFYFHDGDETPSSPGWFMTRGGNFLKGCAIGDGVVPVKKCLRILKNNGYNGNVTIEYEGTEDVLACISAGKNKLEDIIKEI